MATPSPSIDNTSHQMLEDLFGMSTGYVMDPYERYDGSKAAILRDILSAMSPSSTSI